MAVEVVVYQIAGHRRSMAIAAAMREGISRIGDRVKLLYSEAYRAPVLADVAVFYGFTEKMRSIFQAYRAAGKTVVCIDLGYWGRKEGGNLSGYHKFAVNARHPTAYFRNHQHDGKRAARFGLKIEPWRKGSKILLAGMSAKSAEAEGFKPEEWERAAIAELKKVTDREILFRPKPNKEVQRPIEGTTFVPGRHELAAVLMNCHAVVTHHSNVAVEAITAGVPAFCIEGVAAPMSKSDLAEIEDPVRPEGRRSWLDDIAYTQFSTPEMKAGLAWRHLKNEGLVP